MCENMIKKSFKNLIFFFVSGFLFCSDVMSFETKLKSDLIKKDKILNKSESSEIKYAIFDVNGCFWQPHTSDIFNKTLQIEDRKLSLWEKMKMGGYFIAHKLGTINVKGAYEAFLSSYKSKTQKELRVSAQTIWNDCCKDFIYKKSVDLFNEHKKNGVITIVASASPSDVYANLLNHYNFDHICATVMEKKDGVITGKLVGPPCAGKDKKKIVKNLIEKRLGGSLKNAVFYARSQLDIPLLDLVGKPVAFNPDSKLKSYAKIKGWEIVETSDFIAFGKKF